MKKILFIIVCALIMKELQGMEYVRRAYNAVFGDRKQEQEPKSTQKIDFAAAMLKQQANQIKKLQSDLEEKKNEITRLRAENRQPQFARGRGSLYLAGEKEVFTPKESDQLVDEDEIEYAQKETPLDAAMKELQVQESEQQRILEQLKASLNDPNISLQERGRIEQIIQGMRSQQIVRRRMMDDLRGESLVSSSPIQPGVVSKEKIEQQVVHLSTSGSEAIGGQADELREQLDEKDRLIQEVREQLAEYKKDMEEKLLKARRELGEYKRHLVGPVKKTLPQKGIKKNSKSFTKKIKYTVPVPLIKKKQQTSS